MTVRIITGDAMTELAKLPAESVHCCVTSPPYFGLRDYGVAGQLGLEATPDEYVAAMVGVFREVRRVLRSDGTLWLNIGDSYNGMKAGNTNGSGGSGLKRNVLNEESRQRCLVENKIARSDSFRKELIKSLKPKDLIGIPWLLAFALRADGWWLRSEIIWHKLNPMPESVTDRCTKAHEYVFMLSKSERYYFDAAAIAEPAEFGPSIPRDGAARGPFAGNQLGGMGGFRGGSRAPGEGGTRNKRSVWTIATAPYAEAHFATFPPALVDPCILSGTSARGVCPKCGAPWVRVVERSKVKPHDYEGKYLDTEPQSAGRRMLANVRARRESGEAHDNPFPGAKTVGWSPSCRCPAADPVPATVLDCFGGAGTTGLVADRLGRDAILIELNHAYAEMARRRISDDAGMFFEAAE